MLQALGTVCVVCCCHVTLSLQESKKITSTSTETGFCPLCLLSSPPSLLPCLIYFSLSSPFFKEERNTSLHLVKLHEPRKVKTVPRNPSATHHSILRKLRLRNHNYLLKRQPRDSRSLVSSVRILSAKAWQRKCRRN